MLRLLKSRRFIWLVGSVGVTLLLAALALSSPPGDQWRAVYQIRARGGTVYIETRPAKGIWRHIQVWAPEAFGDVRSVSMADTKVSHQVLRSMRSWNRLNELWLNRCQITDEDLRHLHGLKDLHELFLNGNPITDEAFRHLGPMPGLRRLELNWTKVKNLSLIHKHYPALTTLKLRGTRVTDQDLEGLLPEKGWLALLDVSKTSVTDGGFKTLRMVRNLRELELEGTATTLEAIDAFHQAKPDVSVTRRPYIWPLNVSRRLR